MSVLPPHAAKPLGKLRANWQRAGDLNRCRSVIYTIYIYMYLADIWKHLATVLELDDAAYAVCCGKTATENGESVGQIGRPGRAGKQAKNCNRKLFSQHFFGFVLVTLAHTNTRITHRKRKRQFTNACSRQRSNDVHAAPRTRQRIEHPSYPVRFNRLAHVQTTQTNRNCLIHFDTL